MQVDARYELYVCVCCLCLRALVFAFEKLELCVYVRACMCASKRLNFQLQRATFFFTSKIRSLHRRVKWIVLVHVRAQHIGCCRRLAAADVPCLPCCYSFSNFAPLLVVLLFRVSTIVHFVVSVLRVRLCDRMRVYVDTCIVQVQYPFIQIPPSTAVWFLIFSALNGCCVRHQQNYWCIGASSTSLNLVGSSNSKQFLPCRWSWSCSSCCPFGFGFCFVVSKMFCDVCDIGKCYWNSYNLEPLNLPALNSDAQSAGFCACAWIWRCVFEYVYLY